MDPLSSTGTFSFVSQNESEPVLQRKAVLMSNCYTLANYDINREENYVTDQLKVDWERQLLVDSSSFDIANQISKFTNGLVTPLTNLDQTVIILSKVCKKVFDRAQYIFEILAERKVSSDDYLLVELKTRIITAIFVFAGLKRMKATYSHQYGRDYPPFSALVQLTEKVDEFAKNLISLYWNQTTLNCQLSKDSKCIDLLNYNGSTVDTISLKTMNAYWVNEQHFYESMHNLSKYDLQGTSSYSAHQVKAFDNTKLLVLTGSWSFQNWSGNLTSLDKTVAVLEAHCSRMRIECERFSNQILKITKPENNLRYELLEEVDALIHFTIPGIKRMVTTYTQYYASNPDHRGLSDLQNCNRNLAWAEGLDGLD